MRAGEETRLSVTTKPGRKATIILRDPSDAPPSTAHLVIKDASGSTVLDQVLRRHGDLAIQQWLGLGSGRYTVSIEADGKHGTGTIEVAADLSGPDILEITLDQ